MKRVLIIAKLEYRYPRIAGLAKYLPDFGWEPTILTLPIIDDPRDASFFPADYLRGKARIIEVPYPGDIFSLLRRKWLGILGFNTDKPLKQQIKGVVSNKFKKSFVSSIVEYLYNSFYRFLDIFFAYPDKQKTWIKPALRRALSLLEEEKFDIILSSSSPVATHIVAHKLKKRFKIPWVADFRDLWSQNAYYPYPFWRRVLETRLEVSTLRLCDGLITVSGPCAEKLRNLHKGKKVWVITNGFDPELVNEPPLELTDKFTITYTGVIYRGKRDPSKILMALKDLISDKAMDLDDIEVRFYGSENPWLQKKIEEYELSKSVKQYGMISRGDALKKQWESQVLLLLNWDDEREKGIYTGKVFEYLAAKRPILVTGGSRGDVLEELMEETKAGVHCPTVEDIKKALLEFYSEYKREGKVSYQGNWSKIQKYSYKEMAKRFTNVFEQIVMQFI